MWKLLCGSVLASAWMLGGASQAAQDVTKPGDTIIGYPDDGDWPKNESPRNALDNNITTKYLHFKGDFQPNVGPTGFCVTPSIGPTVVTGLTFTTANDAAGRDPTAFELSGSNEDIAGPYALIAKGPIADFAGVFAWPRQTRNTSPIRFSNGVAYTHYRVLFTSIRGPAGGEVDSMQIAEVELLVGTEKATDPSPANGASGVASGVFNWVRGDGATSHSIYIGTSPTLTASDLKASGLASITFFYGGLQPGVTYYWRVDETVGRSTVCTGDVWSFTTEFLGAYAPEPADGSVASSRTPVLRWRPGKGAVLHHAYFSSNLGSVYTRAAAADAGQRSASAYEPGALDASTTYYWRIDELKADGSVEPGKIWSFTMAAPVQGKIVRQWWSNIIGTSVSDLMLHPKYPNNPTGTQLIDIFEGPTDWAENYGIRLCGWLVPPESAYYTFWIASDDRSELWLSSDADPRNARLLAEVRGATPPRDFDNSQGGSGGPSQKSAPVRLQAGRKYFIQALMKQWIVNDNIAVAWQPPWGGREVIPGAYVDTFAFPPVQAFAPKPANRALDTVQVPVLSWSAGEKALQHEVYLGQDQLAVATANATSSLFKGRQSGIAFNPGALEWNKTYYWRIDEVNRSDAGSPWVGAIWSFTTANFISIDDFEKYTDDEGSRVFETWADGLSNGTGAIVGNSDAPFAERTVVHGGKQSMPFVYDNTRWPWYSEAELTFAAPQNWTTNTVDALTLYVRGKPDNNNDRLYVRIEDNAGKMALVVHPDANVLLAATWTEWKIPLSSVGGAVNLTKVKTMRIGVGNRKNPTDGSMGRIYIDDIRLTRQVP